MAQPPAAKRPFHLEDIDVRRGRRANYELRVARLPTDTWLSIPITVLHGATPGPTVWLSGAVHGDELNGIEIIRRVSMNVDAKQLTGSILAVPVVNVFGLINESRYLPDRRDLNRSFPGSARGSLAARIAHILMTRIVDRCEVGIDLHTGSYHRDNLPQVRADLSDPETRKLAEAFAAPVMLDARARDGSLRWAASARGKKVILYEGGQASRWDEAAIVAGVDGIQRVLAELGMYRAPETDLGASVLLSGSRWVRARRSGLVTLDVEPGDEVEPRQHIAEVFDALGAQRVSVQTPDGGIVIGVTRHPLVNRGDAIAHIGFTD